MEYKLSRGCKECENVDLFGLTKIEAAFELYDSSQIWKTPCSKCGSVNCKFLGHDHPKLDQELLDIWGNSPELFLMSQDEELFLAEIDYLPMTLKAIDESKYLKRKIEVLVESVCVLLYDNSASPEEYTDNENKEREKAATLVRTELIKRKDKIIEAREAVMDYIKEIVFPQIGIEIKGNA